MRGVSASAGAEREERVAEEGQGAQSAESPHQLFRLHNPTVRDFYGHYGDLAQVQSPLFLTWKSHCGVSS